MTGHPPVANWSWMSRVFLLRRYLSLLLSLLLFLLLLLVAWPLGALLYYTHTHTQQIFSKFSILRIGIPVKPVKRVLRYYLFGPRQQPHHTLSIACRLFVLANCRMVVHGIHYRYSFFHTYRHV
ncbi:hypothetical protein F5Y09DRAFT_318244 [Xylaria sp. FL1042]|nr:hypothetical protein F5Y09DRAFT_318244 [Xylaria sp. FL1042]